MVKIIETTCKICGKKEEEYHNQNHLPKFLPLTGLCLEHANLARAYQAREEQKRQKEAERKQKEYEKKLKQGLDDINQFENKDLKTKGLMICRKCLDIHEVHSWAWGNRTDYNYYYKTRSTSQKWCDDCSNKENWEKKQQERWERIIRQEINSVKEEDQKVNVHDVDKNKDLKFTIPELISQQIKDQSLKGELSRLWYDKKREIIGKREAKYQELWTKIKNGNLLFNGYQIDYAEKWGEITKEQATDLHQLLEQKENDQRRKEQEETEDEERRERWSKEEQWLTNYTNLENKIKTQGAVKDQEITNLTKQEGWNDGWAWKIRELNRLNDQQRRDGKLSNDNNNSIKNSDERNLKDLILPVGLAIGSIIILLIIFFSTTKKNKKN